MIGARRSSAAARSPWRVPVSLLAQPPDNVRPTILREIGFDQKLGDTVPLDIPFRDETGKAVRLARLLRVRPAGGAEPRLLRLPDALHRDPLRHGERPQGAALRRGQGVRGGHHQLRPQGRPGAGGGQEGAVHGPLQAARRPRRAGTSSPGSRAPSTASPRRWASATCGTRPAASSPIPRARSSSPPRARSPATSSGSSTRPATCAWPSWRPRPTASPPRWTRSSWPATSTIPAAGRYSASILKIVRLAGLLTVALLVAFILVNLRRERARPPCPAAA